MGDNCNIFKPGLRWFFGFSYNLNDKNTEQPVVVNNLPISRTDKNKCLGVQGDEKLSWDSHIDLICKKTSASIGVMRRIKPFVSIDTLEKVYNSLVQPYFEYRSPLWDNCGKLLKDKLQRFQSRAARFLAGANYDIRSADVIQYQDIETNVTTLVCRRGVEGSCFILRRVFLSTLALEKIMLWPCYVVLIG